MPAKALLERAGIPLTDGASAIYHKERKRLITNAPIELSDKITAFLEEELQIVSPTSVSVRLDCRWLTLPIDGEYPWLEPNVVHKGMSLAGVLTQPQIDVVLKGLRADPDVDMLAKPSAIVRSGESAAINVKNDSGAFHLSALATVASDAYTIDLELSFDPPSTERKARPKVSIYDGTSVVFSSQADETRFRLAIVTAQITKEDGAPVRARHLPRQKKAHTVVLDPGHGGQDRGGVVDEVEEKQLTLEFTRQVRRAFEDRGYQVALTRQTDASVPLIERSNMANDIDNALFVSLHFNSIKEVLMRGFETYYPMSETNQASGSMARFVQEAIQERIGDVTPTEAFAKPTSRCCKTLGILPSWLRLLSSRTQEI